MSGRSILSIPAAKRTETVPGKVLDECFPPGWPLVSYRVDDGNKRSPPRPPPRRKCNGAFAERNGSRRLPLYTIVQLQPLYTVLWTQSLCTSAQPKPRPTYTYTDRGRRRLRRSGHRDTENSSRPNGHRRGPSPRRAARPPTASRATRRRCCAGRRGPAASWPRRRA